MSIPKHLVEAVQKHQVIPFVGAGVSRGIKRGLFPGWKELLEGLAGELEEQYLPEPATQLRGLLAWEAVLVAGVAAVLGVLLGVAYGLIGAASVLGDLGEIVLSVPWLQVGAIVVVATLAGLLASVLPARRAARTPPVAAIAG